MKHLKKICVMLTLLLSLAAAPAFSQNRFYMENIDMEIGTSDIMKFILVNEDTFYGFQADITFPPGVTPDISKLTLSERFDDTYEPFTNFSGGVLHIAAYSSIQDGSQTPIKENDGALFTLPFSTAPNFVGGNVEMTGIKFVSESDNDVNFRPVKSPIRVYPTSIYLVPTEMNLFSGFKDIDTGSIEVKYIPDEGFTIQDITWTSSDTSIADVDQNGIVTAEKIETDAATATITATSANKKTDKCTVNVINPQTGLTVSPDKISMEKESTEEIHAVLILENFPTSKDVPTIDYELEDDEDIIVLTETETSNEDDPLPEGATSRNIRKVKTFKIEAKKDGNAKLNVSYTLPDESEPSVKTCEIEVKTYVQKITIEPIEDLHEGDTVTMKVDFTPDDVPKEMRDGLQWYSSDESIATIDKDTGFLTAKSLGEVLITATCPTFNGLASDSYTVTVVAVPAESITIKDNSGQPVESIKVMKGNKAQLIAEVLPESTTDKSVVWTSNNTDIAYVDADGLITAYTLGETIITATCGNVSASCKVTVIPVKVSEILLEPTSKELKVGESVTILPTIKPDNATDKSITWSTNNDAIATVDAEGTVTAIALGEAIITATSVENPKVTATCTVTVVPTLVTSITLNKESESLKVGETVQLLETVLPEDATDKTVTWSSSDDKIATVDANGLVTAVALGEVSITATANDESGVKATCTINVVPTPVESIILDKESETLQVGGKSQLTATVLPENATDKTVTWTSSNEGIATVDANGLVTAIAIGEATITATCSEVSASCSITVSEAEPPTIPVTGISLDKNTADLKVGETTTITATVTPEDATDKTVTWTSGNPAIATVDAEGVVTAIAVGQVNITATCGEVSASCTITVSDAETPTIPVTGISLDKNTADLKVGETTTITATVTPDDATDKTVTWTSGNSAIATVDAEGVVTAVAIGETTITATCGEVSASCTITVSEAEPPTIPVTGISLDKNTADLKVGETTTITATVTPEDATDKTVTWTSGDTTIATVDAEGVVTAVAVGETTITATCGEVSASCTITVSEAEPPTIPVTGISLDKNTADLKVGETTTIIATVTPDDATDKTVTWTSGNPAIATVDAEGVVTAIAVGETTITATCGEVSASCTITVSEAEPPTIPATGISLDKNTADLKVGETTTITATVTPEEATDKTVTWTSGNSAIATVDAEGVVTAIAVGQVNITATCGEVSASCTITVFEAEPPTIPATGISLDKETADLEFGETTTITATVTPDDATDKTVIWTSSNPDIASVDANGKVTAIAVGEATITATCGEVSASCKVTVSAKNIPATAISINKNSADLKVGEFTTLIATVTPENATDKSVTWSSSNPEVASVDESGKVTGISIGQATITASCGNLSASCLVNVIPTPATEIFLNKQTTSLKVGESESLTATVIPDDATDKSVTWTSDNPNIATVDADGKVTAVALGDAIITATCGNVNASCSVSVIPTPAESIILNKDFASLFVDETLVLSATVLPEDATVKTVVWYSSNDLIATVDQNGTVKAISEGEVTITAFCDNIVGNDVFATCQVSVKAIEAESISIDPSNATLQVGETTSLTASILPENTTNQNIAWTSKNPDIASVDSQGRVTANAIGETKIIASTGEISASCDISVVPTPVESISLTNTEMIMRVAKTAELIAIVRPSNATNQNVIWSTDNPSVATVDQFGIVTSVEVGTATITVTSVDNPSIKAECKVTVLPATDIIAVSGISVEPAELILNEGDTYALNASLTPSDATDKTITWRSSDRAVATVSENGVVTAVGGGNAIIYVSSSNGFTVECAVTVIPAVVEATSISISNTELLMREGFTAELYAIIRPENATDKSVTWSSSDETIATVDQNGIVTAIRQGIATITASSANGLSANCVVTVVPYVIAVEKIIISDTELELFVNDLYTLTATIIPDDASDKTVTWRSSNLEIATVDANGRVTAVSPGNAIIYASSSNGLTEECKLTVKRKFVPVESISLSNTELLMREGYTSELFAIIRPENADDKSVVWSSNDETIATVDENGIVTAIKQGVATITATSSNGLKANCVVTVVPVIIAVEEITLNKYVLNLEVDDTFTLIATVKPDDATDKTVTWKSSDLSIATVSPEGIVSALAPGTATIYASSSNGLTAECLVNVDPGIIPVTGISLSNYELLMREGYSSELIAIVHPDNASDKSVTWSSDNEEVATVDANGLVTASAIVNANSVGQATITATSNFDPSIKANCIVTVQKEDEITAVESIALNRTSLEMIEGDTFNLIATITPEDATDKTVTWKSSDLSVAIVSEEGIVTAVSQGNAIIYASSSNGLTTECAVTVLPAFVEVTGISLTNTELLMREGHTAELIAIVHPTNATDKSVIWTSDDEAIATVDQNGLVTAIKQGNTIISATTSNGIKANCYVTVVPDIIAVEEILLSDYTLEMNVEDSYPLIATILPEDATDKTVTWKSSDKSVAVVSENGVVTAVSLGTASVFASSSNGLTAECVVTVSPGYIDVTGISLTNTELLMREGHTAELIAIIHPDNATDKTVTWTSTDENIATVDQNGIVTAIKQGTAFIIASSVNGKTDKCFVTVVPVITAVEEITLNEYELFLVQEDTFNLIATITPEDATDKTVTWKSSNKDVAIVSEDGVVTAVGVGTASIYASSSNGLTAECVVYVSPKVIEVTSVSLDYQYIYLYVEQTQTLTATVYPEDATDKTLIWTSSDPNVAVVENGIVTGIHPGAATITATASNGKNAFCRVLVFDRPLTPKQLLKKGDGTTCTFVVMMDITDDELTELGYKFVYGYNDALGETHVITETPLRYCHTSSEIYNDPSNDFWVFSVIENEEGRILHSNLRHLDGREEVCFDASKYGYGTKGETSEIETIESENWIKFTSDAMSISPTGKDTYVAIYNMTGIQVFARAYKSYAPDTDVIDLRQFTPDTYVIVARNGGKTITKKIVIR